MSTLTKTDCKSCNNYNSELTYFENKYEQIYYYREELFYERIVLLAETMPLFEIDDKKHFLKLLMRLIEQLPDDKIAVIAKLILNGYYLDDDDGRILRTNIILRLLLLRKDYALAILLQMMMVDDVSFAQRIVNSINEKLRLVKWDSARIKSICGVYDNYIQIADENSLTELQLKDNRRVFEHQIMIIIPAFLSREGFLQPPIDALCAAERLCKQGLDVGILDMRVHPMPLYSYDIKCDIAIVSLCTYDIVQNYPVDYKFENAVYTVNTLKNRKEVKFVVTYGPYFDSNLEAILNICHPDYYVLGPVEETIESLVGQIFEKNSIVATERNGENEHIDLKNYYCYSNNRLISPWIALYINRGCPFQCSFCYKHFGSKVKTSSIDETIDKLRTLNKVYGISELFFLDSTFSFNRDWTISFCNALINSGIDMKWQAETRIDCFNKEMLELMKQAGCVKLFVGIESLDDSILNKCNKRIGITDIRYKIRELNNSSIDYEVFLIAGLPGESTDNFAELKKRANSIGIKSYQFVTFMPRPKTPFYEIALKQYPFIKYDFRYLSIVRGIVDNRIKRSEIYRIIEQKP